LRLAALISAGFSAAEVGAVYGLSGGQVNSRIADLRREILRQRP
jgi:hypothetical protein